MLRRSGAVAMAAATAVLGATGCSGGAVGTTKALSTTSPVTVQRVIARLGQQVMTENGNPVTALAYEPDAAPGQSPGNGESYAAALIRACGGERPALVDPRTVRLLYADRRVIDADVTNPVKMPDLHTAVVAPHGCVTGWVTFDVPAGTRPVMVVLTGSSLVGWVMR